jgi:hypothetical protein
MHQASGPSAILFVDAALLSDAQVAFLKENGIALKADCYSYEFPAFYDGEDVQNTKDGLATSCVFATTAEWKLW